MSTYWDVYCVDCDVSCGIDNQNRARQEMVKLAACGAELAKLAQIVGTLNEGSRHTLDFEAKSLGHRVDLDWFTHHLGHKLAARNEYGEIDGQCWAYMTCGECGDSRNCVLAKGHDGEHRAVVPK